MMSWSRLTDRTLSDVDNGDRHASKNTYVILERALDWQPGSIDMILAGGEPIADGVEEPQDEPKAVALDIRDASIRELVEELGRRLDAYGSPQPISGFGGEPAVSSENEATLNPSGLVALVPSS